jgi:spore coat polysaccharide biosynthesis protein SpsF
LNRQKPETALILQARLDSTRLPRKALLPIGGEPMLLRVMQALRQIPADERMLAAPEDCAADFAPLAHDAGFTLITGPKDDVLARYCIAIRASGADRVIRATGDNLFVLTDASAQLETEAECLDADYALYSNIPYGSGVECVKAEALLRAETEAKLPAEREHVCPYLYNHPELFSLHRPLVPAQWRAPALRFTVDTPEDYERAQAFFTALQRFPPEERNLGATLIRVFQALPGRQV